MKLVMLTPLVAYWCICALSDNGVLSNSEKVVRAQTWNFGVVRQDSTVRHTFDVHNNGFDPLVLEKVITSCGCTVASVRDKAIIEPGRSLEVPVEVDLRGKDGAVQASVSLLYEESERRDVLKLTGTVAFEHPRSVEFGRILRGRTEARRFIVRAFPGEQPLAIQELLQPVGLYKVAVVPEDDTPSQRTLEVTLDPSVPYGTFDHVLFFRTNDSIQPSKAIRVRGYVCRPVELSTLELNLGALKEEGRMLANVGLNSPYNFDIRIIDIKNSRAGVFECKVENGERPSEYRLVVRTIPAGVKSLEVGIIKAELRIDAEVEGEVYKSRLDIYALKK